MQEIYKTFETIRQASLKARQRKDYLTLLLNGEALLEYVPVLIGIMVNEEHEYRKIEATLQNTLNVTTEKLNSAQYSEGQAKASTHYREWIKAKSTLDWVYECVNMSKKLASDVNSEYNATPNK